MLTLDLHPYQEPAVEMLLPRQNLLIAMDMGLGKTITALAAAEHLLGAGEVSTVLICAPSGLLYQWAQAIAAATDVDTQLCRVKSETIVVPTQRWCVVIDGGPEKKRHLIEQVKQSPPQYVIASYDTVAGYVPLFRRLAQFVVIDEVTVLKSLRAARAKKLRELVVPWRVGLSGAPVENHRPEEAWAIMNWVDPDLFGDWRHFDRAYIRRDRRGRPTEYINLDTLHDLLSTAMYRKRTSDSEVTGYIPRVKKAGWRVNLDERTTVVYRRILTDLDRELKDLGRRAAEGWDIEAYYSGTDETSGAGKAGAIHLAAQLLLDHPELLRESARNMISRPKVDRNPPSSYVVDLVCSGDLDSVYTTPKLDLLSRKVMEILTAEIDAKIIVVTRFRHMITLMVERFSDVGAVVYHGGMTRSAKAAAVARFEEDSQVRLMFMSHAGAYGVDLPAASYLVNYDPARSSGQRRQINARHVRAGSRHSTVSVVDLFTPNTVEEWSYDLLDLKDRVAAAITDGDGIGDGGSLRNTLMPLSRHVAESQGVSA